MYAIEEESSSTTVTLHVSDPARTQEFYQDLFGLILQEHGGAQRDRILQPACGHSGTVIILRKRTQSTGGPVWLSVEVNSVSEVLDLYLLAIMMGAKAMLPRKRGERWATVITDPDQNRVSIWTRVNDDHPESSTSDAMRLQRWEWRVSPPREDLITDDFDSRSLHDGMVDLPGRKAESVNRGRSRSPERAFPGAQGSRGGTPFPAPGRDLTLEGKE